MSMTQLSAQESTYTDNDRKIEALLQLHENKLNKIRLFELEDHKQKMSEYMKGRDFLISELYDEISIQQSIVKEKDKAISSQSIIINDQVIEINSLSKKINKKNKTILILVGIDVALILGVFLVK